MESDDALEQARGQLDNITTAVYRLSHAMECNESSETCPLTAEDIAEGLGIANPMDQTYADWECYHDEDEARQDLLSLALEVMVRSDWVHPGDRDYDTPVEYKILLCTGGPAVRIVGELNTAGMPESACLEYQDWGTPWTEYRLTSQEEDVLVEFASEFNYV